MEELRDYLARLFKDVPETPEMLRAKAELLQMMEDKYEELLGEGKRSDEAVQIVIDEFGSFEEIGEELGIDESILEKKGDAGTGSVNATAEPTSDGMAAGAAGAAAGFAGAAAGGASGAAGAGGAAAQGYPYGVGSAPYTEGATNTYGAPKKERPLVTMNIEQLRNYLKYTKSHGFKVAAGVALCILAPYITAAIDDLFAVIGARAVGAALGSVSFFVFIALAVGMFVMASGQTKRATSLRKKRLQLDEGAVNELKMRSGSFDTSHSACIAIGIGLCILGPAVSSFSDVMPAALRAIFGPGVLLCAGIGVGLLVYAGSTKNRLDELSKAMKRNAEDQPEVAGPVVSEWNYQPKSMTPVWVIVLLVIILSCGIGVVLGIFRGAGRFFGLPFVSVNAEEMNGKEEFDASVVSKLTVDVSSESVTVKRGDTSKIVCEYHGRFQRQPKIALNGGELRVDTDTGWSFGCSFGGGKSGMITVYVPQDKEIVCNLDLSAGDARVEQVKASQLMVDMSAGNLTVNSCEVTDKLGLDMSAGDVVIDNTPVKNLEADMSAGDFRYHFADRAKSDDYEFDLDTSAGGISFLGSNVGDELRRNSVNGSTGYKFTVDVSAGDVTID